MSKLGFLATLASLIWLAAFSFPDQKLHLIFCDVGQGDAILVTRGFTQILLDGGPNDKVLDCLSRNVPFYDRTLEMVALTHPDTDHVTGLNSVFDQYLVKTFVTSLVGSENSSYQALLTRLKRHDLKVVNLSAGEKIKIAGIVLESLWPTKSQVLGASTAEKNLNNFSLVFLLKYQNRSALLMGDADSQVQDEIVQSSSLSQIDILKFPHHGSKTGMREDFLAKIKPKIAVISVGKNSFGHPTQEALDLLAKYGIQVRRTDKEGEIEYEF